MSFNHSGGVSEDIGGSGPRDLDRADVEKPSSLLEGAEILCLGECSAYQGSYNLSRSSPQVTAHAVARMSAPVRRSTPHSATERMLGMRQTALVS